MNNDQNLANVTYGDLSEGVPGVIYGEKLQKIRNMVTIPRSTWRG